MCHPLRVNRDRGGARRLRLLDLFSKAGGAGAGYAQAGFDVVGVDLDPQPRYPLQHVVADALTFPLAGFDVVHASPPCHDHSRLSSMTGADGTGWMLDAIRERLGEWGGPYVIENVEGASMVDPVTLCGTEFGLRSGDLWLRRHRLFESNVPLVRAGGCDCAGRSIGGVYGQGGGSVQWSRRGWQLSADRAREALGTPWMSRDECTQAVPPAYTRFIGRQLLRALGRDETRSAPRQFRHVVCACGCGLHVEQPAVGRRAKFASQRCRQAAYRGRASS